MVQTSYNLNVCCVTTHVLACACMCIFAHCVDIHVAVCYTTQSDDCFCFTSVKHMLFTSYLHTTYRLRILMSSMYQASTDNDMGKYSKNLLRLYHSYYGELVN